MDLAIIGGGPVGLEAAARAARAGLATGLFEAGEVADHVRAWGWLRFFSPFGWNAGPAGLEVLRGQGVGLPAAEALLTGAELRTHYLLPLVNRGEAAVLFCFVFLYIAFRGGGLGGFRR